MRTSRVPPLFPTLQTKRKYKKIEKQVIEHEVEEGNDDKSENRSTMMKAAMVRAQKLKMMWTVE